jgi:hypothetical protein
MPAERGGLREVASRLRDVVCRFRSGRRRTDGRRGHTRRASASLHLLTKRVDINARFYGAEEVLLSPLVLARAALENAAHTIWILGSPIDSAEDRLARAFLDAIFGAEQAKMQSGRLRGKADEEHKARSDYYKRISTMRERPSRSRTRTSMDGRYYTGTNCHRPSRSSWR